MKHLKEVYESNPETGILYREGKQVGTLSTYGYLVVRYKGTNYAVHRLMWEFYNKPIPKGMVIDHINRIPTDNRLCNLRIATKAENAMNSKHRCDNKYSHKGICFSNRIKKYRAYITINKKQKHLGYFNKLDEAIAARKKEEALVSDFFIQ